MAVDFDQTDVNTMLQTLDILDGDLASIKSGLGAMKPELDGYWAKVEALELYTKGIRKIIKGIKQ